VGEVDNGHKGTLFLLLNFAVNLKLLLKNKQKNKKPGHSGCNPVILTSRVVEIKRIAV
jgi:hypothetical protein